MVFSSSTGFLTAPTYLSMAWVRAVICCAFLWSIASPKPARRRRCVSRFSKKDFVSNLVLCTYLPGAFGSVVVFGPSYARTVQR